LTRCRNAFFYSLLFTAMVVARVECAYASPFAAGLIASIKAAVGLMLSR
jgi:hypothetical protein